MNHEVYARLVVQAGLAVRPLEVCFVEPWRALHLLRHLGFVVDLEELGLEQLSTVAGALTTVRQSLVTLAQEGGDEPDLDAMLAAVETGWTAIRDLSGLTLPEVDLEEVADKLAADLVDALERLPHYLVRRRLEESAPILLALLRASGIVDRTDKAPVEVFRADRLEALLDDTPGAIRTLYAWGEDSEWDASRLLDAIATVVGAMRAQAEWVDVPWALREAGLVGDTEASRNARALRVPLYEKRGPTGWREKAAGVLLCPYPTTPDGVFDSLLLSPWSSVELDKVESGNLLFELPVDVANPAVGLVIGPTGTRVTAGLPSRLRFAVSALDPWVLVEDEDEDGAEGPGEKDEEAKKDGPLVLEGLFAELVIHNPPEESDADPGFSFKAGTAPEGFRLKLDFEDAPDLVQKLVGAGMAIQGDLLIGYDSVDGWLLDLAAGFRIDSPAAVRLGPIQLAGMSLVVSLTESDLTVAVTAGVALQLGPVALSMSDLGVDLVFDWSGQSTSFGPFGIDPSFRNPRRIEIAVLVPPTADASLDPGDEEEKSPAKPLIRGLGYLAHTPGRYEGMLSLEVAGVNLAALGIVTTERPWSMVALIAATFPGIEIGFGFKLGGLGGLLALNRDMDIEALRGSVATGGLKTLLFPEGDVAAQAPQILASLEAFFPQSPKRFAGGLFVRLLWGTGDLWVTDLGVIVSLPRPVKVALIGSSTVRLLTEVGKQKLKNKEALKPEDEVACIRLDVFGAYDGGVPEVSVQAELIDSHVAHLPLRGGAFFLWRGGESPTFVLSVGGYHPEFDVPPGLIVPSRLSYGIETKAVTLSLEAYLALTSNTLQFGANVSLRAELPAINVTGRLGFDVLITFRPFGFAADLYAGLAIETKGGRTLASVSVEAKLTGPGHWTVFARVEIKVLGVKIAGEVSTEFGKDPGDPPAAQAVDLLDTVHSEADDDGSWQLERSRSGLVLAEDTDALVLLPRDLLRVEQRLAPLGEVLQHHHGQPLLDAAGDPAETLELDFVVADPDIDAAAADQPFAPSTWQQLDDSQRLSAPSFVKKASGLGLTSSAERSGASTAAPSDPNERFMVGSAATPRTDRPSHTPKRRKVA